MILVCQEDISQLEEGKSKYVDGDYEESNKLIEELAIKFEKYALFDVFYIELLFSYENCCSSYNKENKYFKNICYLMSIINSINLNKNFKDFCKTIYAHSLLGRKIYEQSYNYLNELNNMSGPNVTKDNMGYFNSGDTNKTLLIYDGGGSRRYIYVF